MRILAMAMLLCAAGGGADDARWPRNLLVQLQVADLDRSIRFYTGTLGFRLTERREDLGFVHIDTGIAGVEIGLSTGGPSAKPPAPGSAVLNFGVSGDIEQIRKTLESKGVMFLGPTVLIPGKVKLASFRDPDGYLLRLAGAPEGR